MWKSQMLKMVQLMMSLISSKMMQMRMNSHDSKHIYFKNLLININKSAYW